MADGSGRFVSTALYVTLGLVGAFVVSAVAGVWDDEPADTGLRAFGAGEARPGQVRVEVLNGAGTSGLARDATYQLRGDGFDVVFFGNADHFRHEVSVVIDRVGAPDRARAVARALGIDSVITAVDSALMLEATVVLGDDWPPTPPPDRSWLERLQRLVGQGDPDSDGAAPDSAAGGS
ncbi:MAG: LytR C-terminal domain-containing protein [Candidatus Longimicrobiales bacterium M2_2A_002]